MMKMKNIKKRALIFIGYKSKKGPIKTAQEEGFKTILLAKRITPEARELFDEVFEVNFHEELIPKLREKYTIKGIISNYEHYVVVRSYLAERFGIPSSTLYSAACTRNKAMQRHALRFMKENIDHRIILTQEEAKKAFKELGGDVFLKSIAGVKSRMVFHIESEKEISQTFKKLADSAKELDEDLYNDYQYFDFHFEYPDPRTTFLMEKAVTGQQVTVASLASNYTIWHAPSLCDVYSASHIGRKDSFLAFRILPSKLSPETIKKVKTSAETAARILGLRFCPVHAEFMISKEGEVKLIEIASRMGGYRSSMYKKAYDLNLDQLLVKSVLGKEIKSAKKVQRYISMMEIFPEKEGKFIKIENLEKLDKDKKIERIELTATEKVGPAKYNYEPCLKFMIIGKSYEEVYKKSMEYQKNLKVIVK